MEERNLNLFFQKTYYESIGEPAAVFANDLKVKNGIFETYRFCAEEYRPCPVPGVSSFLMKTTYPGMLIGTGYAHGSGTEGADDDINCGFSFDYVSGQPYLPGSSVKGILRSLFVKCPEAVSDSCGVGAEEIGKLENRIFGSEDGEDGTDVFFDAVIRRGDKDGKVLGFDFLTPHPSLISDPIPIRILKLLPDVVLEFRFLVCDTVLDTCTVTKETKLKLFTDLLELSGAGAKTNTGYGALERVGSAEDRSESARQPSPPVQSAPSFAVGDEVTCTLTSVKQKPYQATIVGRNAFGSVENWESSTVLTQLVKKQSWRREIFRAKITKIEGKKITLSAIDG